MPHEWEHEKLGLPGERRDGGNKIIVHRLFFV
jgi:hypothetical protein